MWRKGAIVPVATGWLACTGTARWPREMPCGESTSSMTHSMSNAHTPFNAACHCRCVREQRNTRAPSEGMRPLVALRARSPPFCTLNTDINVIHTQLHGSCAANRSGTAANGPPWKLLVTMDARNVTPTNGPVSSYYPRTSPKTLFPADCIYCGMRPACMEYRVTPATRFHMSSSMLPPPAPVATMADGELGVGTSLPLPLDTNAGLVVTVLCDVVACRLAL